MLRNIRLVVLILLLLLVPQASPGTPPAPVDLQGAYDSAHGASNLAWDPPYHYNFTYAVWRDGQALASTSATSYTDALQALPPDDGYLYFVSAVASNGGRTWVSNPAITAVPTLSCEVVTVSTSWNYPYLYAHLHQECLGGSIVYDKNATWTRPTGA